MTIEEIKVHVDGISVKNDAVHLFEKYTLKPLDFGFWYGDRRIFHPSAKVIEIALAYGNFKLAHNDVQIMWQANDITDVEPNNEETYRTAKQLLSSNLPTSSYNDIVCALAARFMVLLHGLAAQK